jgi:hypothetical protein
MADFEADWDIVVEMEDYISDGTVGCGRTISIDGMDGAAETTDESDYEDVYSTNKYLYMDLSDEDDRGTNVSCCETDGEGTDDESDGMPCRKNEYRLKDNVKNEVENSKRSNVSKPSKKIKHY